MKAAAVIFVSMFLGACSTFAPSVHFPGDDAPVADAQKSTKETERETAKSRTVEEAQYYRSEMEQRYGNAEGSLFNPYSHSGLFEDRRARNVGDLLTVVIAENIDSQSSSSTDVSRNNEIDVNTPSVGFLFDLKPLRKSASSSSDFSGDGSTRSRNTFTGTISVVVTDVLPSGNLRVKGERQIGTNREVESVKFYGLVNPDTIRSGNRVVSTEVAEARIEYRGKGQIDSAQAMGWLSRFFLTVLPF